MMKLPMLLWSVFGLITAHYSFAQHNKIKGFVVLNNKDTLVGFIDYIPNKKNPDKISFYKDSMSDIATKYGVADLAYFQVTGYNAYVRGTLSGGSTNDMAETQSVWYRIVIEGNRLSLFEWRNDRSHYYYRENGRDYTELQLQTTNDQGYERELHLYKNQLTSLAIKYGSEKYDLTRMIDNARYYEDDLKKIIAQLNGNENIVQYKTIRQRSKWTGFINGGITFATMKLSGDKSYIGNLAFDPSVGPYFSLGAELSNFGINRLALRLELSYAEAKYKGKGPSYASSNSQITYDVDKRTITPVFSAFYNFLQTKYVSMYAGIGIGYNISSYKGNVWHSTFPELTLADYAVLKKRSMAGNAKMGLRIRKRFEIGAGRQLFDDFIDKSVKYSFDHATWNGWVGFYL